MGAHGEGHGKLEIRIIVAAQKKQQKPEKMKSTCQGLSGSREYVLILSERHNKESRSNTEHNSSRDSHPHPKRLRTSRETHV